MRHTQQCHTVQRLDHCHRFHHLRVTVPQAQMAAQQGFYAEHSGFCYRTTLISYFLFLDVITTAQMLICHCLVTLMVLVLPVLLPASWRDKWPDFFPEQRIMAVTPVLSAVCRGFPDFPVGLVYQPCRACASVVPLIDKSAQKISYVALSATRWNLRHTPRLSAQWCLTFHSPSPKTFRPVAR